jgi:hypothetical protein
MTILLRVPMVEPLSRILQRHDTKSFFYCRNYLV